MPAAGVALLEKWYPDSFRFVDKASAQFFEHFEVGKEERLFGIVDGDHTEQGARADLKALAELDAGMIVLDDTSWIPKLEEVGRELENYDATEFPEYNGITLLTRIR